MGRYLDRVMQDVNRIINLEGGPELVHGQYRDFLLVRIRSQAQAMEKSGTLDDTNIGPVARMLFRENSASLNDASRLPQTLQRSVDQETQRYLNATSRTNPLTADELRQGQTDLLRATRLAEGAAREHAQTLDLRAAPKAEANRFLRSNLFDDFLSEPYPTQFRQEYPATTPVDTGESPYWRTWQDQISGTGARDARRTPANTQRVEDAAERAADAAGVATGSLKKEDWYAPIKMLEAD